MRLALPLVAASMLAACATLPPSEDRVVRRACAALKTRFNDPSFDCRRLRATLTADHWLVRQTWPPGQEPALGGGYLATVDRVTGRVTHLQRDE